MSTATSVETPDLLTQVEAQRLFDASLDMLDALESLILYQSGIGKDDLKLDVWINAIKAVKKAGAVVYL
jgi:hypothetical protein